MRVLVLDDNLDVGRTLAALLKHAGHDVRLAHDGPAAIQIARDYQPETVLVDIGLPGMDGYELARRLRNEAGLQRAMLAALTGYGHEEDRRRSDEAGFDHHLTKPVRSETLLSLLSAARAEQPLVVSVEAETAPDVAGHCPASPHDAEKYQEQNDQQHQADAAAGVIAPLSAVRPSGGRT
jgi:CheY-like chemotaxis protein